MVVVVVGLGARAVADPDARFDARGQQRVRVFRYEARQILRRGRRLNIDRRWRLAIEQGQKLVDSGRDRLGSLVEIEIVHVRPIGKKAFDSGGGFQNGRRCAVIHRLDVGGNGLRALAATGDGRPRCHEAFQKDRAGLGQDLFGENTRGDVVPRSDGWKFERGRHGDRNRADNTNYRPIPDSWPSTCCSRNR